MLTSRLLRALPASLAAAAMFALTLGIAPASVAAEGGTTATYDRKGAGADSVVADSTGKKWPAGSHFLKLADGTELEVFCIEFNNFDIDKTGTYRAHGWPAANLDHAQLSKAADIAARHKKIGTPLSPAWMESAAAQVAIWTITDNIDHTTINNADLVKRVNKLIARASATRKAPAISYELDGVNSVAGTGEDAKDRVSVMLTSPTGATVAEQDVVFVVDGVEQTVKTDGTGIANLDLPRSEIERKVSVRYQTKVAPGAVFIPESGKQALIATTGYTLTAASDLTVAAAQPPAEDPVKPTKDPVKEKPTKDPVIEEKTPHPTKPQPLPEELPTTGALPALMALAGAGALVGGGLWGRRRFRK